MNITYIKKALYSILGTFVFLFVANTAKAGICPAVGASTDCGVQINVTAQSGGMASAFTVTPTGQPPYDNVEDTLVGITNNTGATINSITLTSSDSAAAFSFDGDGACGYGSLSGCGGTTGYEGPNMTFDTSGVDIFGGGTLVINFTGGLAAGASTWFSLEGSPNSLTGNGGIGGATPEPTTLLLLASGLAAIGFIAYRRSA